MVSNPTCNGGHYLKCVSCYETWSCDKCFKEYKGHRFGCHEYECDFDVCHKCVGPVYNVVCTNGHLLRTIIHNYGEWLCNNHINGPLFNNCSYLGCDYGGCDYALCNTCSSNLIPIHIPVHKRVRKNYLTGTIIVLKSLLSAGLNTVGFTYNN